VPVFSFEEDFAYIVLGIDENEHDQVLAVCRSYEGAKRFCIQFVAQSQFYDLWIEKHPFT
jgi:hypothetical protein